MEARVWKDFSAQGRRKRKFYESLTHFSMRACPLITDKALEAVAGG